MRYVAFISLLIIGLGILAADLLIWNGITDPIGRVVLFLFMLIGVVLTLAGIVGTFFPAQTDED